MQDTSITWADWTWNPIRGCSRISPGCQHCYAEALAARHSVASAKRPNPPFAGFAEFRIIGGKKEPHWTGKVELIEEKLLEPLSWRKRAKSFAIKHGRKPRGFISMSDLFHEALPDEAIDHVFAVMALTPEINYMILTKRAERMAVYVGDRQDSKAIYSRAMWMSICKKYKERVGTKFPLPNVALGVSVESQKYADERIPHLLRTPAAMRFVSYEPALEAVDWDRCYRDHTDGLCDHETSGINMILIGGESGQGARPFDIAWARQAVAQCRAAGVAPFVKQMGARVVTCRGCDDPACKEPQSYRDRKGEDMTEWPEDLRVREWPEGWN